jgi:hypothetical protein
MKISALYKDYDIFTVNKQNCTFFITYGQPVVNTVSLYFHNVGENGLFPTFERDPPYGENDWTNVKFSPIFVMTSFSMDTNLDEESSKYDQSIRFRCMNKKCVPWTDHQPDIYKTKGLLAQKSIPIFECAVTCNQNLIEDEIDKDTVEGKTHSPKSVLSMVKSLNSQGGNIQNTIQNAFGPLISLFAIIFLAMMFILIAMILRNKKKNFR